MRSWFAPPKHRWNRPRKNAAEYSDRRRSRRWAFDISVYVYGHGPEKEPFHEEAHT